MKRRDYRGLYRALNKAFLTGVSLLTLVSCEITPEIASKGVFYHELLDQQELLCGAIRRDEKLFEIRSPKIDPYYAKDPVYFQRMNWHSLELKHNDSIELSLSINYDEQTLMVVDFKIDGRDAYLKVPDTYIQTPILKYYEYSNLEKDHCERMMLPKSEDAFSDSIGVPASSLDFSSPKMITSFGVTEFFGERGLPSQSSFRSQIDGMRNPLLHFKHDEYESDIFSSKKLQKISDEKIAKRIDWETIFEFNLDAYNIWNGLRKSYTDEEIRSMYFNGEIKEYSELKNSLKLALGSVKFRTTYNGRLIDKYHPAFTQILLEIFIEEYVTKETHIENFDDFTREETWEREGQTERPWAYEDEITKILQNKESSSSHTKKYYGFENEEDYIQAKIFDRLEEGRTVRIVNSIILVQTLSHKNCYEWGLRPELMRFLLPYRISGGSPLDKGYGIYHRSRLNRLYERHIMYSVLNACGKINEIDGIYLFGDSLINYNLFSPYIVNDHTNIMKDALGRFLK